MNAPTNEQLASVTPLLTVVGLTCLGVLAVAFLCLIGA